MMSDYYIYGAALTTFMMGKINTFMFKSYYMVGTISISHILTVVVCIHLWLLFILWVMQMG